MFSHNGSVKTDSFSSFFTSICQKSQRRNEASHCLWGNGQTHRRMVSGRRSACWRWLYASGFWSDACRKSEPSLENRRRAKKRTTKLSVVHRAFTSFEAFSWSGSVSPMTLSGLRVASICKDASRALRFIRWDCNFLRLWLAFQLTGEPGSCRRYRCLGRRYEIQVGLRWCWVSLTCNQTRRATATNKVCYRIFTSPFKGLF